jgi:hypothetical protein
MFRLLLIEHLEILLLFKKFLSYYIVSRYDEIPNGVLQLRLFLPEQLVPFLTAGRINLW